MWCCIRRYLKQKSNLCAWKIMFRCILKTLRFLALSVYILFKSFIQCIFPPCKKSFAGEIVLITGAANGIGRQIALHFAPLEATLVLWDIDEEGNRETTRLAKENGAKQVFAYYCDCSNREEVYQQAEKVSYSFWFLIFLLACDFLLFLDLES